MQPVDPMKSKGEEISRELKHGHMVYIRVDYSGLEPAPSLPARRRGSVKRMISQTIEYALRAMTHLASLEPGVSVNSETIAARTKVPQGYLSKILRDLVVAQLITSQRGPNGGFCLVGSSEQVSILDIVNAVDPIQRIKRCPLGNPLHVELCPLHNRLDHALAMIEQEFKNTTLAELLITNSKSARRCNSLVVPTVRGKKS